MDVALASRLHTDAQALASRTSRSKRWLTVSHQGHPKRDCNHDRVEDGATCLICRDCGAVGRIHHGLMRAMVTGKQIDGPVFLWSDGKAEP